MPIEDHAEDASSQSRPDAEETEIPQAAHEREKTPSKTVIPVRLPAQSQAAIAQRLNDVPERPDPGFLYSAPHLRQHPAGWRTRRYLKRKKLRLCSTRAAAVERKSTRTLRNMSLVLLTLITISAIALAMVASFAEAVKQHFGNEVVRLEDILPGDSLRLYDAHGQQIYEATNQGLQISIPLSKMSHQMINAQVAIEDQSFWKNPGVDITGIVRAAIDDLTSHHIVSGGSTITQQLVKNAIVGNKETVVRKLQEVILAPDVTRYYTKKQILAMYLNTTFYGEQSYGVEAAAFNYYDVQDTPTAPAAAQLDLAQSAMLAGIVSSPSAYDPYLHPQAALDRMKAVLGQMYLQGYITPSQRAEAVREAQQPGFLKRGVINNTLAPHFTNYVLRELSTVLHVKASDLPRSGLVVSTTLDLPLQNQILKIAQQQIAALQGHHVTDAAEVVIDYHTGAIRALLGNSNPAQNQFDIASQGFRQPGSSFKPFAYVRAFEAGISPGMPVLDGPTVFSMCCGLPPYMPHDYSSSYMGLVSYRTALQNSLNIPALKLVQKIGYHKALRTAQKMGVRAYVGTPNLTLVLGSLGVHLVDETSAYGAFGNHGVHVQKHAITTIKDTWGHLIYRFNVKAHSQQVVTPQAAFIMTNVLSDNVARTPEFGKCSPLWL